MTIYADSNAHDTLSAYYPKFLARIDVATEARTLTTPFGDTHVLIAGPVDAPPLVVFHGALASSAHVLAEMVPLLSQFRVYAPDIIGHSPKSADKRLAHAEYGPWAEAVFDALGLEKAAVIGVSYGGFVAVQTAITMPTRITKLSLIVPGGLVSGSAWDGIFKLAIPMALYKWSPTEARLKTFLAPQFSTPDPLWTPWMGDAIRLFKLDFRAPPLATPESLKALTAPVQVLAADDDVHFPGPAMLARAKVVFPNLVTSELLRSKHSPPFTTEFRNELSAKIAAFLKAS